VERRADDLWIFIGPRKEWRLIALLVGLLGFWTMAGIWGFLDLLATILGQGGRTGIADALTTLVWFLIGVAGLLLTLFSAFVAWGRRESIYLSRKTLFKRISLGPWVRDTVIPFADIREFRLTTPGRIFRDWGYTSEHREWGIAVVHGEDERFLLVNECRESSGRPRPLSIVLRTRLALENFSISVTPLRDLPPRDRLPRWGHMGEEVPSAGPAPSADSSTARPEVGKRGPKRRRRRFGYWDFLIVPATLVLIAVAFWSRRSGSPYESLSPLLLGCAFLLGLLFIYSDMRKLLRPRPGSPFNLPSKGLWEIAVSQLAWRRSRTPSRYPGDVVRPTTRPKGRFSLERHDDRLWIFIGPCRRLILTGMACLLLLLWAKMEAQAIYELTIPLLGSVSADPVRYVFGFLWLAVWTLIGGIILYLGLLEAVKREEICVTKELIYKRSRIGRWIRETRIDLRSVRAIRMTTPESHPRDWKDVLWKGKEGIGVAVLHGRNRVSFLLRDDLNPDLPGGERVIGRVHKALFDFGVPVIPLDIPVPEDENESPFSIKRRLSSIFDDEGETPDPTVAHPTGPKSIAHTLIQLAGYVLFFAPFVACGIFWVLKGGIPDLLFVVVVPYLILIMFALIIVVIYEVRRVRTGKRRRASSKKESARTLYQIPLVLLVCVVFGGIVWIGLLSVPSSDMGHWDVVRRRVYSVGKPESTRVDAAGNRYEIHTFMENARSRLHKFGPDGRLRWVITLPAHEFDNRTLEIRPDGTLEFKGLVSGRDKSESYSADGHPLPTTSREDPRIPSTLRHDSP